MGGQQDRIQQLASDVELVMLELTGRVDVWVVVGPLPDDAPGAFMEWYNINGVKCRLEASVGISYDSAFPHVKLITAKTTLQTEYGSDLSDYHAVLSSAATGDEAKDELWPLVNRINAVTPTSLRQALVPPYEFYWNFHSLE